MSEYDLVVRNGTVATAADVFRADIGVTAGRIATIGAKLPRGRREIDAQGKIVTPGGVDSHCHIAQRSSLGGMRWHDDGHSVRRAISRDVVTPSGEGLSRERRGQGGRRLRLPPDH